MTDVLERDTSLEFKLLPIASGALLEPITGASGSTGPFLLYDEVYDRIRAARQADNPMLPQGIWETSLKRADWDSVIADAAEALCHKSKDLQLAAWLVEAAIHRHGFEGLAEALAAMRALLETFWPDLHPRPDEGDLSGKLAPVVWMNAKLPPSLRLLPLTKTSRTDDIPYCLADWEEARGQPDLEDGTPIRARIRSALDATDLERRRSTATFIDHSITQLQAISTILDDRCGDSSPGLGGLHDVLVEAKQLLTRNTGQTIVTAATPTAGSGEPSGNNALSAQAITGLDLGSDIVRGRDDAYAKLALLANYLIELEPHSPAPYLVRRAVAWGEMPLPVLLREFGREYGDVDRVIATLGLSRFDGDPRGDETE